MQAQFKSPVAPRPTPPRQHEAIQTYHCWRCKKRSFVRRTYSITFVDGRPVRVYEILAFAGSPRCLVCGETLELEGMMDAEYVDAYCARRCMTAPPTSVNPCQCKTCGGSAHGVTYQGD